MEKYEPEKVFGWRVGGHTFKCIEDAKAHGASLAFMELRDLIASEPEDSPYHLAQHLVKNSERVRVLLGIIASGNPEPDRS